MPDTGMILAHQQDEGKSLPEICARLKQAATILERSAYDLATLQASPDVTHLILSAETVERITHRLSNPARPD